MSLEKENIKDAEEHIEKEEDNEDKFIKKEFDFMRDKYDIFEKIGEGTFSSVYKGICKNSGMKVAIKAIVRTSSQTRILEELKVLQQLGGENFCIPLIDVQKEDDKVMAVFPLVKGKDFKEFLTNATNRDVQYYMHCLLKAVAHMHSHNLMHRDIKPSNFLYNMDDQFGFLVDFGLAQKAGHHAPEPAKKPPVVFFNTAVKPGRPPGYYENDRRPNMKAPRAGTRGFRAPEVLFKSSYQTTAIDVWSVGVVFLCILTMNYPFFLSTDDIDALVELAQIFGHAEMRKTAKLHGRSWKCNIESIKEERTSFRELVDKFNSDGFVSDEAVDLLTQLLELNPKKRISAEDALKHKFFNING